MNRHILATRILPTWTTAASAHPQPVAVLVAGQPGAGKTVTGDLLQAVLEVRGPVVRVCSDLYKSEHPHYAALLAADVRLAGAGVRLDVRRWQAAVEDHVRAHRLDAVVETALADVAEVRAASAAYRAVRQRVDLVVVATPPAASALGIVDRYLNTDTEDGGGRWVSWENHDGCVAAMLVTLAAVEAECLVDRITVVRRDGAVLYANHLNTAGSWTEEPGAVVAVEAEHRRPWSARETALFRRALADADRRVHREVSGDRRLAVQRDVERAAALAEPVRRIAQPILSAPGVDYHRLSADEFRWIWDNLVVPGWLDDITPHHDPLVTYVVGQDGAGHFDAGQLVRRALRHRDPIGLDTGAFAASHPDTRRLMQEDPRRAHVRVRADSQAWQRMAEARVREHRGDMVVELVPDSVGAFRANVAADRAAGYRVELLVLGVRPTDSRQHAAARYALLSRTGPAAYLDPADHAAALAVLPELVAAAEAEHLVDAVTVMRRDHTAVYRNARSLSGRWGRPARAAAVLLAEHHRPYTDEEAGRYAAAQRWLFAAMPQYRTDLHDIARLARPLLPARWRPAAVARVHSAAALPARRATA
ncbi:zeta toxin family protein [Streptodolium elevatio]|uniref:UDP-N-acetylglucosamine kinase n=1 Tax=Streptodolium elevatio TaxID=3157996 RepID=A0ABV3DT56_9ACTN